MNGELLPQDYGGFDPRFLGVSLRFSAESTWTLFKAWLGGTRDSAAMATLGARAGQSSDVAAFELLSSATVLSHELRHFHDALVSSLGTMLFRKRLIATANTLLLFSKIFTQPRDLVVPLPVWRSLSPHERSNLLAELNDFLGNDRPLAPFDPAPDELIFVDGIERIYASIRDCLVNPETRTTQTELQPYHIFEASAVLVQVQEVFELFGVEHSQRFLDFLFGHPRAGTYLRVAGLLQQLWNDTGRHSDSTLMSAVLTWCLLGDYERDAWDACPTVRFTRLYAKLRESGPPTTGTTPAELFGRWSKTLGLSTVEDALRTSRRNNELLIGRLEQNAAQAGSNLLHNLLRTAKEFTASCAQMSRMFEADSNRYVALDRYRRGLDDFVAAPILIELAPGGALGVPPDGKVPFEILDAARLADGRVAILRALWDRTPGTPSVDGNAAYTSAIEMTIADICFATFRRDDPSFDVAREILRTEYGILTPEILR